MIDDRRRDQDHDPLRDHPGSGDSGDKDLGDQGDAFSPDEDRSVEIDWDREIPTKKGDGG